MRVRSLLDAVLAAPRKAQIVLGSAVLVMTSVAVATPLALASAPAAAAAPRASAPALRLASVSLGAPTTVTRGGAAALLTRLSVAGVALPGRPVQLVQRAPGATVWQRLATVTTGADGTAAYRVGVVSAPTEFGAYYSDANGFVRSATATAVVHVIDMKPAAPTAVAYDAPVRLAGHLLQDARNGIASQRVQVRFRSRSGAAWSAATWVTTNSSGVATLTRRFTHSFQVGIRFPGANGLAPSPLAVATVTVKPRVATTPTGFRFPFLNPGQAEGSGSWSLDQGVDMFAYGEACGSAAKLVAVGDGTVIQTGISGFGSTAPVISMSDGPFRGRNVYYGHTGRIFVHVGQQVRAGQVIAEIGCGQVGYSSAPHLEIGVGEPGGPPCCPARGATASEMYHQLVAALRR